MAHQSINQSEIAYVAELLQGYLSV